VIFLSARSAWLANALDIERLLCEPKSGLSGDFA
jgi:hypothetical protein